jgi:hypothetical protein
MPALADLEALVRTSVVTGDTRVPVSLLIGGEHPEWRMAVHARHYHASLTRVLVERFPATVWLLGSGPVLDAARDYVRSDPPTRPCLSEYGEGFPSALAAHAVTAAVPYVRDFAELEYRVGAAALAVDGETVGLEQLAEIGHAGLPEARLTLQPGVRYLRLEWAVDALLGLYLRDSAPDQFELERGPVWLEVRGSRGDVGFERLSDAEFTFRAAVREGLPLGDGVRRALARDPNLDVGQALARLFVSGLVVGVIREAPEGTP